MDKWSDPTVREDFRVVFSAEIEPRLRKHGITIHPDYVDDFELSVARAFRDGEIKRVSIAFEGDHSPDPASMRFPPMDETFPGGVPGNSMKDDALRIAEQFDACATAAQMRPQRESDGAGRWVIWQRILDMTIFARSRPTTSATGLHTSEKPIFLRERSGTFICLHCAPILGWLVEQRTLRTNAATGIRVRVPKTSVLCSRSLSDDDAALILKNALEPQSSRLGDKHVAARAVRNSSIEMSGLASSSLRISPARPPV
ncbi:hypothetical protein GGR04_003760 [Aureimonas pseudogalii]|uniref:Uncharacterized protein n=1 Tax=Aureimonas pseudogalii TaxID=1744844 RepID=A0A7W6H799_9HYPH|nr:hypothetical protein [Aureimonas pseudogalii]MBB3999888.1 hypothetical protein [Aureimonas pseudogalii]